MNILIKNANLISMSENRPRYEENIDVLIENNKITKIEKNIFKTCMETSSNSKIKVIDATGKVVMPGLINTHAHLPMSIFRETIDGYGLQEWLEDKIWPMENKLIEDDIYFATYLSCIEMIKTGCTTINDMYFMTDEIIKAALETGIRLQTTKTLISGGESANARIETLKKLIDNYSSSELISFNAGIHGLYTTKEEDTKKFVEFAKSNNIPIHMHFCENSKEVEDIKKYYDVLSPIEVLEKYFTDIPVLLAHAVKLNEKEIEKLAVLKNISVSHCPVSNLKLGCGIANISKMLKEKINVSLGTDGQGSGSNLDMFETMKFTALLQKGINEEPKTMPAYEVMKMATVNGARALGLEKITGSVDKGKQADIIIIDMDTEVMQPVNDIFSNIVYNAKGNNVDTTIVNGRVLMENKKINCKEKEIYEKCGNIIKRIR